MKKTTMKASNLYYLVGPHGAMEFLKDKELPADISARLLAIYETLTEAYAPFEKVRMSLVEKYGKPKEDGTEGLYVPAETPEYQAFSEDVMAAFDEDVEIDFRPIPLSDLKRVHLSMRRMADLKPFVIDDIPE